MSFVQNTIVHYFLSDHRSLCKDAKSRIISTYFYFFRTEVVKLVKLNYSPLLQIISSIQPGVNLDVVCSIQFWNQNNTEFAEFLN